MKRYLRVIALGTLIFFGFQEFKIYSAPPAFSPPEVEIPALPQELGTLEIKSGNPSNTDRILFHIQDAHASLEAQKNIQKILRYLQEHHRVKTLLLEGGEGKLQPELLKLFPKDRELNSKFTDLLFKKAELTGAELHLIDSLYAKESQERMDAYGIETAGIYLQNRRAFQEVLRAREKTENFLKEMDQQIERLSSPHLNPALKNFLRQLELHETQKMDLKTWFNFSKDQAEARLEIDFETTSPQREWPMLVRFYRIQKLEALLVPAEILKEKMAFLAELEKLKISDRIIKNVGALLVGAREGRGQAPPLQSNAQVPSQFPMEETLNALGELLMALPEDFSFKPYPHFKASLQSLIFKNEIQGAALFDEIKRLETQLLERLAKTETEKKLVSLFEDYRLLKKLFALELTREEYQTIVGARFTAPLDAINGVPTLKPSSLLPRFLEINSDQRVRNARFSHREEIDRLFNLALDFYGGALKRDEIMSENALGRMKAAKSEKAILITGGFHSEGMREEFTRAGFTYYLISPRISESVDSSAYQKAMLEENLPAKKSQIANILKEFPRQQLERMGGKDYSKKFVRLMRSELRTLGMEAAARADRKLLQSEWNLVPGVRMEARSEEAARLASFVASALGEAYRNLQEQQIREPRLKGNPDLLKIILDIHKLHHPVFSERHIALPTVAQASEALRETYRISKELINLSSQLRSIRIGGFQITQPWLFRILNRFLKILERSWIALAQKLPLRRSSLLDPAKALDEIANAQVHLLNLMAILPGEEPSGDPARSEVRTEGKPAETVTGENVFGDPGKRRRDQSSQKLSTRSKFPFHSSSFPWPGYTVNASVIRMIIAVIRITLQRKEYSTNSLVANPAVPINWANVIEDLAMNRLLAGPISSIKLSQPPFPDQDITGITFNQEKSLLLSNSERSEVRTTPPRALPELDETVLMKTDRELENTVLVLENVKPGGPEVRLRIQPTQGAGKFRLHVLLAGKRTGTLTLERVLKPGSSYLQISGVSPFRTEQSSSFNEYENRGIMSTVLNWLAWEAARHNWEMRNSGTTNLHLVRLYQKYFADVFGDADAWRNFKDFIDRYGLYGEEITSDVTIHKRGNTELSDQAEAWLLLKKIPAGEGVPEVYRVLEVRELQKTPFRKNQTISVNSQGGLNLFPAPPEKNPFADYETGFSIKGIQVAGKPRNWTVPRGTVQARHEVRAEKTDPEQIKEEVNRFKEEWGKAKPGQLSELLGRMKEFQEKVYEAWKTNPKLVEESLDLLTTYRRQIREQVRKIESSTFLKHLVTLIAKLNDPNWAVRHAAATALGLDHADSLKVGRLFDADLPTDQEILVASLPRPSKDFIPHYRAKLALKTLADFLEKGDVMHEQFDKLRQKGLYNDPVYNRAITAYAAKRGWASWQTGPIYVTSYGLLSETTPPLKVFPSPLGEPIRTQTQLEIESGEINSLGYQKAFLQGKQKEDFLLYEPGYKEWRSFQEDPEKREDSPPLFLLGMAPNGSKVFYLTSWGEAISCCTLYGKFQSDWQSLRHQAHQYFDSSPEFKKLWHELQVSLPEEDLKQGKAIIPKEVQDYLLRSRPDLFKTQQDVLRFFQYGLSLHFKDAFEAFQFAINERYYSKISGHAEALNQRIRQVLGEEPARFLKETPFNGLSKITFTIGKETAETLGLKQGAFREEIPVSNPLNLLAFLETEGVVPKADQPRTGPLFEKPGQSLKIFEAMDQGKLALWVKTSSESSWEPWTGDGIWEKPFPSGANVMLRLSDAGAPETALTRRSEVRAEQELKMPLYIDDKTAEAIEKFAEEHKAKGIRMTPVAKTGYSELFKFTVVVDGKAVPLLFKRPLQTDAAGERPRIQELFDNEKRVKQEIANHPLFHRGEEKIYIQGRRWQHPNIRVGLWSESLQGLVMPYIEPYRGGTDAYDVYIRKHTPLTPPQFFNLALQMSGAVGYLHSMGFVHRDIKPNNFFMSKHRVILTDFNLAFNTAEQRSFVEGGTETFTPKELWNAAPDYSHDVYTLGMTLLRIWLGSLYDPQANDSFFRKFLLLKGEEIPDRVNFRNNPLEAVIRKAMSKDPYKDVIEMEQAIRAAFNNSRQEVEAEAEDPVEVFNPDLLPDLSTPSNLEFMLRTRAKDKMENLPADPRDRAAAARLVQAIDPNLEFAEIESIEISGIIYRVKRKEDNAGLLLKVPAGTVYWSAGTDPLRSGLRKNALIEGAYHLAKHDIELGSRAQPAADEPRYVPRLEGFYGVTLVDWKGGPVSSYALLTEPVTGTELKDFLRETRQGYREFAKQFTEMSLTFQHKGIALPGFNAGDKTAPEASEFRMAPALRLIRLSELQEAIQESRLDLIHLEITAPALEEVIHKIIASIPAHLPLDAALKAQIKTGIADGIESYKLRFTAETEILEEPPPRYPSDVTMVLDSTGDIITKISEALPELENYERYSLEDLKKAGVLHDYQAMIKELNSLEKFLVKTGGDLKAGKPLDLHSLRRAIRKPVAYLFELLSTRYPWPPRVQDEISGVRAQIQKFAWERARFENEVLKFLSTEIQKTFARVTAETGKEESKIISLEFLASPPSVRFNEGPEEIRGTSLLLPDYLITGMRKLKASRIALTPEALRKLIALGESRFQSFLKFLLQEGRLADAAFFLELTPKDTEYPFPSKIITLSVRRGFFIEPGLQLFQSWQNLRKIDLLLQYYTDDLRNRLEPKLQSLRFWIQKSEHSRATDTMKGLLNDIQAYRKFIRNFDVTAYDQENLTGIFFRPHVEKNPLGIFIEKLDAKKEPEPESILLATPEPYATPDTPVFGKQFENIRSKEPRRILQGSSLERLRREANFTYLYEKLRRLLESTSDSEPGIQTVFNRLVSAVESGSPQESENALNDLQAALERIKSFSAEYRFQPFRYWLEAGNRAPEVVEIYYLLMKQKEFPVLLEFSQWIRQWAVRPPSPALKESVDFVVGKVVSRIEEEINRLSPQVEKLSNVQKSDLIQLHQLHYVLTQRQEVRASTTPVVQRIDKVVYPNAGLKGSPQQDAEVHFVNLGDTVFNVKTWPQRTPEPFTPEEMRRFMNEEDLTSLRALSLAPEQIKKVRQSIYDRSSGEIVILLSITDIQDRTFYIKMKGSDTNAMEDLKKIMPKLSGLKDEKTELQLSMGNQGDLEGNWTLRAENGQWKFFAANDEPWNSPDKRYRVFVHWENGESAVGEARLEGNAEINAIRRVFFSEAGGGAEIELAPQNVRFIAASHVIGWGDENVSDTLRKHWTRASDFRHLFAFPFLDNRPVFYDQLTRDPDGQNLERAFSFQPVEFSLQNIDPGQLIDALKRYGYAAKENSGAVRAQGDYFLSGNTVRLVFLPAVYPVNGIAVSRDGKTVVPVAIPGKSGRLGANYWTVWPFVREQIKKLYGKEVFSFFVFDNGADPHWNRFKTGETEVLIQGKRDALNAAFLIAPRAEENKFYYTWPDFQLAEPQVTLSGFYAPDALVWNFIRQDRPSFEARRFTYQMMRFLQDDAREKYPAAEYPLRGENISNPHAFHYAKRMFEAGTIEIFSPAKNQWVNILDPSFDLFLEFGPLKITDPGIYEGKMIRISRADTGYRISAPEGINVFIRNDYLPVVREQTTGKILQNVYFAQSFSVRGKLRMERRSESRIQESMEGLSMIARRLIHRVVESQAPDSAITLEKLRAFVAKTWDLDKKSIHTNVRKGLVNDLQNSFAAGNWGGDRGQLMGLDRLDRKDTGKLAEESLAEIETLIRRLPQEEMDSWIGVSNEGNIRGLIQRLERSDKPRRRSEVRAESEYLPDILKAAGIALSDYTTLVYPGSGNYDDTLLALLKNNVFPGLNEYHLISTSYAPDWVSPDAGEKVKANILSQIPAESRAAVEIHGYGESYYEVKLAFEENGKKRIWINKGPSRQGKEQGNPEFYLTPLRTGVLRPGDLILTVPTVYLLPFWKKEIAKRTQIPGYNKWEFDVHQVTDEDFKTLQSYEAMDRIKKLFSEEAGNSPEVYLQTLNLLDGAGFFKPGTRIFYPAAGSDLFPVRFGELWTYDKQGKGEVVSLFGQLNRTLQQRFGLSPQAILPESSSQDFHHVEGDLFKDSFFNDLQAHSRPGDVLLLKLTDEYLARWGASAGRIKVWIDRFMGVLPAGVHLVIFNRKHPGLSRSGALADGIASYLVEKGYPLEESLYSRLLPAQQRLWDKLNEDPRLLNPQDSAIQISPADKLEFAFGGRLTVLTTTAPGAASLPARPEVRAEPGEAGLDPEFVNAANEFIRQNDPLSLIRVIEKDAARAHYVLARLGGERIQIEDALHAAIEDALHGAFGGLNKFRELEARHAALMTAFGSVYGTLRKILGDDYIRRERLEPFFPEHLRSETRSVVINFLDGVIPLIYTEEIETAEAEIPARTELRISKVLLDRVEEKTGRFDRVRLEEWISSPDKAFAVVGLTLPVRLSPSQIRQVLEDFRPMLENHKKKILFLSYEGELPEGFAAKLNQEFDRRIFLFKGDALALGKFYSSRFSEFSAEEKARANELQKRAFQLAGESSLAFLKQNSLVMAEQSLFEKELFGIAKQFSRQDIGLEGENRFAADLLYALRLASFPNTQLLQNQPEEVRVESISEAIIRLSYRSEFLETLRVMASAARQILAAA